MKKILLKILQLFIGCVFILSAFLKLFPIEPFELYIYSFPLIGWNVASIVAILIIGVEFSLGLLILFNVFPKKVLWFTLFLITAFTIYLISAAIIGNEENCYCFGAEFNLNPFESILKNLILIIIIGFLLFNEVNSSFKKAKLIFITIIIVGIVTPIILRPPDFIYKSYYSKGYDFTEQLSYSFLKFEDSLGKVNLAEGKKVICFFSTGCKYCKLAAKKISILSSKSELTDQIYFIFTGNINDINNFYSETGSLGFRHIFLSPEKFFPLSGKRIPSIYFVADGEIKKNFGYRGIFQRDFEKFLKK